MTRPSDRVEAPDPTRTGLVLATAVGLVGVTFGVLTRSTDLSVAQACAMSLLVFTGASQFAVVGVLASGGGLAAGMGAAVLLAARNMFYGPIVGEVLGGPRWKRLLWAQVVIDESAGVAASQPDAERGRRGFVVTGLGVFVLWNLGTLVGALGGDVLGDPDRFGLDAAFPACFVALLAPHLVTRQGRAAAIIATVVAVAAVPLVPAGVPILLAAFAVIPAALIPRPVRHPRDPGDPGSVPEAQR